MNAADLTEFLKLAESPIRGPAREEALRAWDRYKQHRQLSAFRENRGDQPRPRHGSDTSLDETLTKGDSIAAQTLRAIDLRGAALTDICIGFVDLRGVMFDDATFAHETRPWTALKGANLTHASLRRATLAESRLMGADLTSADLADADLRNADLSDANLQNANLGGADLAGANLQCVNLSGATIEGCRLDGARVYGVAAWDLNGEPASSRDLLITNEITTDDIRVAQFLYLLINNPEIRNVLDAVTRKVVLILGRFKPERKRILDALRDALRARNFVPVLFDFDQPADRDITETVTLLARMARFVIADLTDPASIPQELQAIAPHVAVPITLIIEQGGVPYSMVNDLKKYPWVIRPFHYQNLEHLLDRLEPEIIESAEAAIFRLRRQQGESWGQP